MSYKRYLFETGGYQTYEYARVDTKQAADEKHFAEIHNNLRNAAVSMVGIPAAIAAMLRQGAKTSMLESRSGENLPAINEAQGGSQQGTYSSSDSLGYIAGNFANTPFVGIRQEGKDKIVLIAKGFDARLVINPFDPDQERLLQQLFPGYMHPKEWVRPERSTIVYPKFNFSTIRSEIDQVTVTKLLNGVYNLYMPNAVKESPEYQAIKPMPKDMGVSLNMIMDVDTIFQSRVYGVAAWNSTANEGALPSTAAIGLTINIRPELHLPINYAHWTTYCESPDEFVPFIFMTHIGSLVQAAIGAVGDKPAQYVGDLKGRQALAWKRAQARKPTPISMERRNKAKEEALKFRPRIKTDANGYIITPRNLIIRLPKEGMIHEYQQAANEWYASLSEGDAQALATGKLAREKKFAFPPSVLYIDHHNEVMVYTTQQGTVTSLNLRGSRPLDNITIARVFGQEMRAVLNGGSFLWTDKLLGQMTPEAQVLKATCSGLAQAKKFEHANALAEGSASPLEGNPIIRNFVDNDWSFFSVAARNMLGYQHEITERIVNNVYRINNGTDDESEAAIKDMTNLMIKGGRNVIDITRTVWSSGSTGHDDGSVINKMTADTSAYIVGMHGAEMPKYVAERMYNRRHNLVDGIDRSKPLAIPNIDTERMSFMFPHQAEFVQNVNGRVTPPKYAVIGAAPGGGKTNMIIADINLLLSKALINRPVVTVPNQLVRQFVSEINEFTNGRMNAFPLTYQHVRDVLMNPLGFNMSTAELIDYLKNLPRNTIIVTNYNTLRNNFSDMPDAYANVGSYDNFGNAKPLKSYPFVEILNAVGVDYICGDESHKIKNQDSDLAQAFLAMCAKCEYVRLSSGTTINNVITDLVGQLQKINPAILGGDPKEFAAVFLGDSKATQITDFEQALEIKEAIHDYSLEMQRDSRSWDYMLPKMREMYHRVALTPLQTRYYNILFSKALNHIQEDAGTDLEKAKSDDDPTISNKIERVVARHFSIVDRFVNDPTQFPDFVDGSFVYEEYKIANDGQEAEPGSLELAIPNKEDLISVKAQFAYLLMYAHLEEKGALEKVRAGGAANFTPDPTNKIIVMAPNKFVGNHVWNNLPADLKRRAVRYVAGAFNKVEQFKTDDNIKIMVADEVSISEGHNLQVGSRIIRMQQVWTPGGEVQSLARIRRPDPFGKYNRDSLGYDIIVATRPNGQPTIDDLRIARLLAKKFNNAMVEFGFDPSFRNEFISGDHEPLEPISMSMDIIKSFPEEMLEAYFDQQARFNRWFNNSAQFITKQVGREAEIRLGKKLLDDYGNPINIKDFVAAVVVPTVQTSDMAGTSSSYVPWLPGVQPINPLGFDMQPIRSFAQITAEDADDEDEEEEDEDSPDNVEVEIGDYVMTEFGPGIVAGRVRNGGKLDIYIPSMAPTRKGDKYKKVRLPKTCVYVPEEELGAKILAQAINSKTPQVGKPPKTRPVTTEQRQKADDRKRGSDQPIPDFADYDELNDLDANDFDLADVVIEDDEEDDEPEDPIDVLLDEEDDTIEDDALEEEEEETEPTIFAQAFAINGQLAIVADDTANGAALDKLYSRYGFKPFPDMVRVEFKTRKALDIFLGKLVRGGYAIPRPQQAEIDEISEGLSARGKLRQIQPFDYKSVTNFMITEQRRVPKKTGPKAPQTIRLYPIVFNGKFYLCASVTKHPFPITRLLGKAVLGIPGAGKPQEFDNMGVKFYRSLAQAKSDAKKMIKDGDIIEDTEALIESFDSIQGGHIEAPETLKPPPAKVTEVKPKINTGPSAKPKSISMDGSPKVTTFREEKFNPGVETVEEFQSFLRSRRATLVYVRGSAPIPKGVPLRVVSVSRDGDQFSVAERPDTPVKDRLSFDVPDEAEFDEDAGTMRVGKSLWRLSYAG